MYKQIPNKATGRTRSPFKLKCVAVKITEKTRIWGGSLTTFTDKGRFKISNECHDLIDELQIGEEYWFQYFTNNDKNTVVDVLNK